MLAGVNEPYAQAVDARRAARPGGYHVNLIPYNPTDAAFEGSRAGHRAFKAALGEPALARPSASAAGGTSTPPAASCRRRA